MEHLEELPKWQGPGNPDGSFWLCNFLPQCLVLMKFQGCPFLFPLEKCLLIPFRDHRESLRSAGGIVENKGGVCFFFWYKSTGCSWWHSKSRDCFCQPVVAVSAINFPCCLLKCVLWVLLVQQAPLICQVFTSVNEAVSVLGSQGPKNP